MSEVNDEEGKEVEISAMTHEGKHNVTKKEDKNYPKNRIRDIQ